MGAIALIVGLAWELLLWDSGTTGFDQLSDAERFFYDSGGGNHLFGIAVGLFLIWRRRRVFSSMRVTGREGFAVGILLLALAIGLRAWSSWTGAVDLQLPALALLLLGSSAIFAGSGGLRTMGVPAVVLLLAMPIPIALVNALLHPMQLMTASGVGGLLDFLGIEHAVFGEQIRTHDHVFYVIEGCAGLQTLRSIAIASVFYLDLLYRNRRQVIVVLSAAFAIAIGVNQLRVLGIVLFPGSGWALDHTLQGLVMICLGVVAIAIVDAFLQGVEGARSDRSETHVGETCVEGSGLAGGSGPAGFSVPLARRLAIVIGIVLYGGTGLAMPAWSPPEFRYPRAAQLPIRIDGWRAERTLLPDREYLGSATWSDHVNRVYSSGGANGGGSGGEFEVLVLVDDRLDRRTNFLSSKTELARPGYRVLGRESVVLSPENRPATYLELESVEGSEAVLHWRIGVASLWQERLRAAIALDQSGLHREKRGLAVRVAMRRPSRFSDPGEQRAALQQMAVLIDRAIHESGLTDPLD